MWPQRAALSQENSINLYGFCKGVILVGEIVDEAVTEAASTFVLVVIVMVMIVEFRREIGRE